ncbi:hypothetical protein AALA24_12680 [Anaerovoracaceae bacterium 42-11]
MLNKINDDKRKLEILNNLHFDTTELRMIDKSLLSPIELDLDEVVAKEELNDILNYPWIALQACTTYYYDFLYEKEGRGNTVTEVMFFLENEIETAWNLIKKTFRKALLFKTSLIPANVEIYRVDVTGISNYGKSLLTSLDEHGELPLIWKRLFLSGVYPCKDSEGIYDFITENKIIKQPEKKMLQVLMKNPFFNYMDLSAISLTECEEDYNIQFILQQSSQAVISVEKDDTTFGYYTKRLCWKK